MTAQSGLLSRLPDISGLEKIWTILPEARLVGGSVRDLLRGLAVNDLDLATPEPPEVVLKRLKSAAIRAIPTGLSHGTITALINHIPHEITTLRRDEETDGRHAVVVWTKSWQEDAARRDFTINAMSLDRHDKLHDYFHGVQDLKARRVRFVGHAARRIEEDALRALRFFRFDARYGEGEPDCEACEAIADNLKLVGKLSAERVASEFLRILTGPRLPETLAAMEKTGLLNVLIPGAQRGSLQKLLDCAGPPDALLRLFALSGENAVLMGAKLKLSNADKTALGVFGNTFPDLAPSSSDDDLRRGRVAQSLELLISRSWLAQARILARPDRQWDHLRIRLKKLPQPVFPLGGKDAQAFGVPPGPAMGAWLRVAREWWLEHGCRPDREACLAHMGCSTRS